MTFGPAACRIFPATVLGLTLVSSSCSPSGSTVLTADMPLHLEDHLEAATIVGSDVPAEVPSPVEWSFDEPQLDWKPTVPLGPPSKPAQLTRTDDALRVTLTDTTRYRSPGGGLYIDLPDWKREDWTHVLVRAQSTGNVNNIRVGFNLREAPGPGVLERGPFQFVGETAPLINDGNAHSYLMQANWSWGGREGPWQQLGFEVTADGPATLDILSVSVIPAVADYAGAAVGVRTQARQGIYRRSLYTHAPGTLEYTVRVPDGGRLDVGLGVVRDDIPVAFRITATPEGGEAATLLEETYADKSRWAARTVDLSPFAGQTITLGKL